MRDDLQAVCASTDRTGGSRGRAVTAIAHTRIQTFTIREESDAVVQCEDMPAKTRRRGEAVTAITHARIQTFAIREESDAVVQSEVMPAETRSVPSRDGKDQNTV